MMITPVADNKVLHQQIRELAKRKNALILAHYYQRPEIQEVADFVGDSLELARKAKDAGQEMIVFAGVKFMAESAKILNPGKRVFLPDLSAGCSLADNCEPEAFGAFLKQYPDHVVVSYVNTSAEIKAMSDVICTSSNAEAIVKKIPAEKKIVFAPDANLGRYVMKQTGRDMVLWNGACIVHEAFSLEKLLNLVQEHPDALLIAHPESEAHILNMAHFVGSTKKMIDFVQQSDNHVFIVATEAGILLKMQEAAPGKTLIPAPANEDNTCACSECAFMKVNTLEKIYECLLNETPEITLEEQLIRDASVPMNRMFEWN